MNNLFPTPLGLKVALAKGVASLVQLRLGTG